MKEYKEYANEYCEKWIEKTGRSFKKRFLGDTISQYMQELDKSFIEFTDVEILELLLNRYKLRKMSTIDNYLKSYSDFYDYLIENGVITRNPCDSAVFDRHSITSALSKMDIAVYSPTDIDSIIASAEHNTILVEAIVRLIYEGFANGVRGIAEIEESDWDGGTLRRKDDSIFVPSERLAKTIFEIPTIKGKSTINGKNYVVNFDGRHLFPHSMREYDSETYIKRQCQSFASTIRIAEEETGKLLDYSTLYYSGMMWKVIGSIGKEGFIDAMLRRGDKKMKDALLNVGYNDTNVDYIRYRYRFFAFRLQNSD